jgi:Macrocin-O-methyltransferase (TylF)
MRDHEYSFPNRVCSREEVWKVMQSRIRGQSVLYLEFGVAYGASILYWSRALDGPQYTFHGFDSFEGLPETGGPWRKGQFSSGGAHPFVNDPRVGFFKGWFHDVLPAYVVPSHDLLILNLDADLYSSTIFVLNHLRSYIKPGTLIYFDEMNHVDHEPKAFDEFLCQSEFEFKPLCADRTLAHVSFECIGRV